MTENATLSKARISYLAKLKQKKYRLAEGLVVLEGARLISQLSTYNVLPLELYYSEEILPEMQGVTRYKVQRPLLTRICDSENPAPIAGLYPIPQARTVANFRTAMYFQDVSDPGNLGTIFRSAEAFGTSLILLSPSSCEVSSPKVIRASLGACYKLPFAYITPEDALAINAHKVAVDMDGRLLLNDFRLSSAPTIFFFGSEAHGLPPDLKGKIKDSISIPMRGEMESVNLAVSASILAYQLSLS